MVDFAARSNRSTLLCILNIPANKFKLRQIILQKLLSLKELTKKTINDFKH